MYKYKIIKVLLKTWLPAIIFFLLLSFYYLNGYKTTKFFVDEYCFIRKSYYFDLFFVKRDFTNPKFITEDDPLQPKVGPYIYGAVLHFTGFKDIEKSLFDIQFNYLEIGNNKWWLELWNRKLVDIPQKMKPILDIVYLERKISVLFTLGFFIILFLFSTKVYNSIFGFITVSLLGLNNLMFYCGTLATTDSMLLFFYCLTLLLTSCFLRVIKSASLKKIYLISVLIGISCALGTGVKVTGILIFIFLIIFYLTLIIFRIIKNQTVDKITKSFLLVCATFLLVFILLHPYLYDDTFQRFIFMFTSRLEATKLGQIEYPGSAIYSRRQALEIIIADTLLPKGRFINFSKSKFPIDLLLFVLGFFLILKRAIKKIYSLKLISSETILIVWSFVVISGLIFYLRNNWPRYFLLMVVVVTTMQAYAITSFLYFIKKRFITKLF